MPDTSEDDEAVYFMAKELEEASLNNISGIYDFDICFDPDENELETFEQSSLGK